MKNDQGITMEPFLEDKGPVAINYDDPEPRNASRMI